MKRPVEPHNVRDLSVMGTRERIVVFGGSGYVGGAVSNFVKNDYDVTVADVRPPHETPGVSFAQCDVRERGQVQDVLRNASAALYFSIVQIPKINSERRLGYEVNVLGLQNVCEAVFQSPGMRGMIHAGTWHVFGERGLNGTIDESFGSRPDKVEERARLYALSKVVQEGLVRFYDEMAAGTGKVFGVVRMGTVLGAGMPETTAANLFIKKGIAREALTPYRHSMHRPMLYVDIRDICRGYASFLRRIVGRDAPTNDGSLGHVVNLFWPEPITVLELAEYVKEDIAAQTDGKIKPQIKIEDKGLPEAFAEGDKRLFRVDGGRAEKYLGISDMTSPRDSVRMLVSQALSAGKP